MHKFLILLLIAPMGWASYDDLTAKWTRHGYIVVTFQGEYISRHVNREEAYESAFNHAYKSGNTGELEYLIAYPDRTLSIKLPEIVTPPVVPPDEEPPPEPPPPPVDTGEELDPNTVYFCPSDGSGARGTTAEPPGSNSNDGTDPAKPLATLDRLGVLPAGTDVRLCEGGVFADQRIVLKHGGDIGETNRLILGIYGSNNFFSARTSQGWKKGPELVRMKMFHKFKGWDSAAIDRVIVGCYKNLNGVYRPCMNSLPLCKPGTDTKCLDPESYDILPSYRG